MGHDRYLVRVFFFFYKRSISTMISTLEVLKMFAGLKKILNILHNHLVLISDFRFNEYLIEGLITL